MVNRTTYMLIHISSFTALILQFYTYISVNKNFLLPNYIILSNISSIIYILLLSNIFYLRFSLDSLVLTTDDKTLDLPSPEINHPAIIHLQWYPVIRVRLLLLLVMRIT